MVVQQTASPDAAAAPRGQVSPAGGEAAVSAVRAAAELALAGRVDALATGPLNKASMRAAGYQWAGHTELLADVCGAGEVSMLLLGERLRVAHVTTHVALERVPELVTGERIRSVVRIAVDAMRRLGRERPRIAVAGLNPHAGEGGMFGDQEQEVVAPAIEALREEGVDVVGPIAGDAVFVEMERRYDIVVVMYHDQGHIPIKLVERDDAVNVTGGLPIVRTSVDHGTGSTSERDGQSARAAVRALHWRDGRLALIVFIGAAHFAAIVQTGT
jgi:4-phospho-D-threonate 3-dehydrogenase / 4-phospho-D-erythronate 3-dehydrogenase